MQPSSNHLPLRSNIKQPTTSSDIEAGSDPEDRTADSGEAWLLRPSLLVEIMLDSIDWPKCKY